VNPHRDNEKPSGTPIRIAADETEITRLLDGAPDGHAPAERRRGGHGPAVRKTATGVTPLL
jgi:hypothetical protein